MKNQYGFCKNWTQQETDFLEENYGKITVKEISKNINRTEKSILNKAFFLKIKSDLVKKGMFGMKHTEEAKRKMSLASKKMWLKKGIRKNIINSIKTRWNDPIYQETIRQIHIKRWKDPQFKEKMINSMSKKMPLPSYQMSPELAYVLGVMMGDGFVQDIPNQYYLKLWVKDKDFAINFKNKLEKWSGYTQNIKKRNCPSFKQGFGYIVIFHSKKAVEIIKQFLKQKKRKSQRLLYKTLKFNMLNAPKECQIAFLEGLYDSEGCVSKSKHIKFTNTNLPLIRLVSKMIFEFGIPKKITYEKLRTPHSIPCMNVLIYGKENLKLFDNLIQFSIQRKENRLNNLYLRKIKK